MNNKILFGCRISRIIQVRDPSGITKARSQEGGAYQRELVLYPYDHVEWNAVKDTAFEVESLGYDSLILPDHLMLGKERLEAWTTMAALGALTKTIRLLHLVLCASYRGPPTIFAKQSATLDFITNGRFDLGIGAGYEQVEFEAYGIPWRPYRRRIAELDEYLDVVKLMWTQDEVNYDGQYYKVKGAYTAPKPVQKPHPPIVVGGYGKPTLKVAAKHANWINVSGEIANCKRSIRIVEEHCQSIGRDPSEISKSWGEWAALFEDEDDLKKNDAFIKTSPSTWCGTPEQYVDRIQEYVDLGVSYITPRFVDLPSKKSIRLFAERVIPQFK
ncbi:MAG: LLM class flavin-dependent oxidoreductase [Candidatus Bathyarchaeota archaeon]|nr:MAG: LLM class flavin-dependent oxidoreductase [Candidatus Bathyarchaeota archaeon]